MRIQIFLFCICGLLVNQFTSSFISKKYEKYPYLKERVKTITDWGEYFITKEESKYVLFIFYNIKEESDNAKILK